MSDLRPEVLAWTALLGQWMDYARASLALPDDDEGGRWKRSVTSVVNLQAVTFALRELATLKPADQPLAWDRAAMLVQQSQASLDAYWRGTAMPEPLVQVVEDAARALDASSVMINGWELTWPGERLWVMPIVELPQQAQTLLVMQPGSLVMPGEPVAWGQCCEPLDIEGCRCDARLEPRQVYRMMDDAGAILSDVVAVIDDADPPDAGMPLLVPWFADGRRLGHFTMEADDWLAMQRAALGDGEMIDVSFCDAPT